ncbi:MAG TPA: multiubiquitin domain-containing protein [Spongiibacteraceae bacterium]|nr:multiubiquitin domain-containing protein [Spongiibacteraceae bacterium]
MSNEHADDAPGHNKDYTIIVNGRQRTVQVHKLSYWDVVLLAYPGVSHDEAVVYTVAYANPHGRDGTLAEGQDVTVKEEMSFNVSKTNRS